MENLTVQLFGTTALIMDKSTGAVDKVTREFLHKRQRSEAEEREVRHLRFMASLCIDENGPYIPATWLWLSGLRASELTHEDKNWERGLHIREPRLKLDYKGPRDADALFADPRFVDFRDFGFVRSKMMVARPVFQEWSATATLDVVAEVLDPGRVLAALHTAGRFYGIGNFIQQFGRFSVRLVASSSDLSSACNRLGIEGPGNGFSSTRTNSSKMANGDENLSPDPSRN